jgi:sigma-B regulation protein RsbU (phosphoserine phosphatase)
MLEDGGVPLGVLPTFPFVEGEVTLAPGNLLAVFSDGIPEAMHGEDFFGDERLCQSLIDLSAEGELDRVSDGLMARVAEFIAGEARSDDVTLVLARRR